MTRFMIVPQWQGSDSPRAMRLIDGAQSIAGDLPRASCTTIDVASEAGDAQDTGVRRHSAIARTRDRLREALAQSDDPTMLIGGDCGAAVGAIEHVASRHPDLVLVWFDAHADLHTPETSPSGAFGGMALRAALGEGTESLRLNAHALSPTQVVMAGVREYDDSERAFVGSVPITVIDPAQLAEPDALADAVSALGATKVYVHIDLDVLDPSAISGVTAPVPFGAQVADVVASISQLRSRVELVGSSICGFAPASPAAAVNDLGSILRLVGSLA
ncbi:arginase family protein [Microbacterium sp. R86528]|uniref:arginase family protein n=1 Tax=Microbacterium sp. R86528 TaxID=3093864 RepID=UPI0037C66B7D